MKENYINNFKKQGSLLEKNKITKEDYKLMENTDLTRNIYNSKCVGIMANKIYDISESHSCDKSDKLEEFIIDFDEENSYDIEGEITIDSILIDYDYIGIMDDPISDKLGQITLQSNGMCFEMYSFNGEENLFDYMDIKSNFRNSNKNKDCIVLFNNFNGSLNLKNCYRDRRGDINIKIFKQGIDFYVNDLILKMEGTINGKKFNASKNYRRFSLDDKGNSLDINPVKITTKDTLGLCKVKDRYFYGNEEVGLNLNPINMAIELKLPSKFKKVDLNLNITSDLLIDSIIPTGTYDGSGRIIGNVRYNFVVDFIMYGTIKEEMAIFIKN